MQDLRLLSLLLTQVIVSSVVLPARADFSQEYRKQSQVSWDNAQYEEKTENLTGDPMSLRYQITEDGTIYKFNSFTRTSFVKVGNLNEQKSTTHTWGLGTTLFLYQYRVENCKLYEYSKARSAGSSEFGSVSRKLLGTCLTNEDKLQSKEEEIKELEDLIMDGTTSWDQNNYEVAVSQFSEFLDKSSENFIKENTLARYLRGDSYLRITPFKKRNLVKAYYDFSQIASDLKGKRINASDIKGITNLWTDTCRVFFWSVQGSVSGSSEKLSEFKDDCKNTYKNAWRNEGEVKISIMEN